MSTILFVADAAKYGIVCNEKEGLTLDGKKFACGEWIVRSGPFKCHNLKTGVYGEKGQFILDSEKDKERLEHIRKYPEYKKMFIERKSLPNETFQNGSVVTGAEKLKDTSSVDVKSIQKAAIEKTQKWAVLQRKLFKEDGTQKQKIEEADLVEFNKLSEELGLQTPTNEG